MKPKADRGQTPSEWTAPAFHNGWASNRPKKVGYVDLQDGRGFEKQLSAPQESHWLKYSTVIAAFVSFVVVVFFEIDRRWRLFQSRWLRRRVCTDLSPSSLDDVRSQVTSSLTPNCKFTHSRVNLSRPFKHPGPFEKIPLSLLDERTPQEDTEMNYSRGAGPYAAVSMPQSLHLLPDFRDLIIRSRRSNYICNLCSGTLDAS